MKIQKENMEQKILNILKEKRGHVMIGEIMGILNENRIEIRRILIKLEKEGKVIKNSFPGRKGKINVWKIKETEDGL